MSDIQLVETTVGELRDALMRILHSIRELEHRSDDILLVANALDRCAERVSEGDLDEGMTALLKVFYPLDKTADVVMAAANLYIAATAMANAIAKEAQ